MSCTRLRIYALVASLPLLAASTVAAQTTVTGQTANGSYYKITAPAGWAPADGLVIWNHGVTLDSPAPDPDLGPLISTQLAEGYAVAASSFSLDGWALFRVKDDLEQLYAAFQAAFGTPSQVLVYGASLGGLATVQALETASIGNVVGAMSMCAPLAGSRLWDGIVDLRLLYDAVCAGVPGAAIPGGAGGLPNPSDPAFDQTALVSAVNACTGVSLPVATRSGQQQANLDLIVALTTIPEEFVVTDMVFATFGLHDLVFSPEKLFGRQAMHNVDVVYADAQIDATIARVTAIPIHRNRLFGSYSPDGSIDATKVIALHTSQDGLMFVEHLAEYANIAPGSQFVPAVVAETVPSHCGFTEAEVVAAWEALRGWVAGLPQPTVQNLQDTCNALVVGNLAVGPCRIDPAVTLADLDSRIPPRPGSLPAPPPPTLEIPTLGDVGLVLLTLALAFVGVVSLRSRL